MIKRAILYTICIFLLGSINSCKKKKHVHIKGRVYNPITNDGIKDVELWLLKSTTMEFPGGNEGVATIYTGEDGYFEMDEYSKEATKLRIGHMPGDYYKIGWYQNGVQLPSDLPVKRGETQYADFQAVPYGELQINIKNTAYFDQNDKLSIFRTHSIPGFYDDVPNPAIYTGCVNQEGNMNKAPMGWYKYKGTFTKNGIETPIKDSIYLNENETKVWKIYY